VASEFVVGFLVGALGCLVLLAVLSWSSIRRLRRRQADEVASLEAALIELRQELAEDKETNRRLRHELAVKTPGNLLETAATAEMERNGAISERDQALEQLGLVERDLAAARARLAKQESKLRRYREGLQEIRMSLEAQGRERESLGGAASMLDTGEINGEELAAEEVAVVEVHSTLGAAAAAGGVAEAADLRTGD
jgi:chromosome segregation ATPase